MNTDSFDTIFSGISRVMSIFAHPDDTEIYCGGTLARLIASNIEVLSVKMSDGGKGSQQTSLTELELSSKRQIEDSNAASILGIKPENNIHLQISDGEIEDNLATIEKLTRLIRNFQPNLIITHNPEDVIIRFAKNENWVNHRDHRHTGRVAVDAAYPYSRDRSFFPNQLQDLPQPINHTTKFLFGDYYDHQDTVYIDITNFYDTKIKSWQCHASQYTPQEVLGLANYLNKNEEKFFEAFRFVIAD